VKAPDPPPPCRYPRRPGNQRKDQQREHHTHGRINALICQAVDAWLENANPADEVAPLALARSCTRESMRTRRRGRAYVFRAAKISSR
jgi:hypothetical protein